MPTTLVEKYNAQMAEKGIPAKGVFTVSEALSTPDSSILIPRVVSDVMREAAEPLYIGSKFLQVVKLGEGRSIEFPSVGAIRAFDVAEGQEYPNQELEFQRHKTNEIRVNKVGLKCQITDEMISDSQWDVIGLHLRAAGRAMARFKEEKIFTEFTKHGHAVFDNDISAITHPHLTSGEIAEAHTTGLDIDRAANNTISVEDVLDMIIALMANGYAPSDILMHPLVWTMFAKDGLFGSLGQAPEAPVGGFPLGPNSVQGRMPFGLSVWLSPFIPFDRVTRKFDMYAVDRNEVGILLVKDEMTTEQFDNPLRDIISLKVKERYGIGVLNEGKAIAVAKNITFAKSYPDAQVMRTIS